MRQFEAAAAAAPADADLQVALSVAAQPVSWAYISGRHVWIPRKISCHTLQGAAIEAAAAAAPADADLQVALGVLHILSIRLTS